MQFKVNLERAAKILMELPHEIETLDAVSEAAASMVPEVERLKARPMAPGSMGTIAGGKGRAPSREAAPKRRLKPSEAAL